MAASDGSDEGRPLLHDIRPDAEDASGIRANHTTPAATGRWRACAFIIVYELMERVSYYGITANLVLYMKNSLHFGAASAAQNVSNWLGATTILPIFGAFIADTYWGKYWTIVYLSTFYVLGMLLLTLSASVSALKPAECASGGSCPEATSIQLAVLFTALYLIAIGTGGVKPCLEAFGADQFDEDDPVENKMKSSFFNWWYFGLCMGALLAFTVIIYVEDNASYGTGYGILTVFIILACGLFLGGTPLYRKIKLSDDHSPLLSVIQVFVAAARKWSLPVPENEKMLYECTYDEKKAALKGKRQLVHTKGLRCLDKAAIPIGNTHPAGVDFESLTEKRNPWRLCTVTQVEEVKLIIRILPIWLTTIVYGLVISQSLTFFVEQASTLDRAVGSLFTIPSASLLAFSSVAILIMLPIYECCITPLCRWLTSDGSGITLLQRLGIGLLLSVLSMIIAALVERKRLTVAADYGLLDDSSTTIPMSVFWLVPQYMLFGISDVFALVGQQEFFYDQVPDNMRSIGMALYLCGYGVGSYLSSALVSLVEAVTSAGGNSSWIVDNLNRCRLDYYYYLLAALSFVNFGVFVLLALSYSYKGSHVRSL